MESRPRRNFVDGVRARRERHRERSRVVRAAAVFAGFVVVLAGLAMIPLPGPGLLVTAVGLAVLALEFAWAERLLERTVDRMGQASETVRRASRVQQILLALLGALAGAAFVTAAYAWDIPILPV
ncbi:MAG: TIGR02611 family protein [Actinobacteria bacterium]|nr:MAG: TIGR02611 family protein [Actinomycetota bacterium]